MEFAPRIRAIDEPDGQCQSTGLGSEEIAQSETATKEAQGRKHGFHRLRRMSEASADACQVTDSRGDEIGPAGGRCAATS
jgi:hypothetical protein